MYVGTILIGFAIHALISLPITLLCFTRQNPFRIMKCAAPSPDICKTLFIQFCLFCTLKALCIPAALVMAFTHA